MTSVVFYFQVHQPYRLQSFKPSDIGTHRAWFDEHVNREIVRRVSERCYLPMNRILLEQIEATDKRFRCSFSLSGTVLSQLRDWVPEAIDSFVALAETGCVEFLAETSHHSLAFEGHTQEFLEQVRVHRETIEQLFGSQPTTFRNTELCINETIAKQVEELGFDVLLGEGADRLLGMRSARHAYRPRGCKRLKLLLRSYEFSDDIAFRFSNHAWDHHPLFASTFASWLHAVPDQTGFIGLFMDYETFGEHQWAKETGILEFMKHLPGYVLEDERFCFKTPAELCAELEPLAELAIPDTISWADQERDLTAWLGNLMQQEAHRELYALMDTVRAAAAKGDSEWLEIWRRLTTSDHVYYMCTKYFSDGDVHEYFTPYDSPHEAYVRFLSVLADLRLRIERGEPARASRPAKTGTKQPARRKRKQSKRKKVQRKRDQSLE